MGEEMISVVCWKWEPEKGARHEGKRRSFSCQHVNVLKASIDRNTTIPYKFVCVTDDWKGLDSTVEYVNIDRHFPRIKGFGGCFRRLRAFDFSTAVALFGGRFISIDIDSVVVGNMDKLLSFRDDFRIWMEQYRRRTPYCGSLWGMKSGARQEVWSKFENKPYMALEAIDRLKYTGTDQAHISVCLYNKERTWGQNEGVYNFNTQIRRKASSIQVNRDGSFKEVFKTDGNIPKEASIVFFNGKYDPSQTELQRQYPWIGDHWRV
jgi:hypothetical protein